MSASNAPLSTAHWQYAFVPVRDVDTEGFVKLLAGRKADGGGLQGPDDAEERGGEPEPDFRDRSGRESLPHRAGYQRCC